MAYSQNVLMQLTNPTTGIDEELYTKARDDSVLLEDGSTLRGWIDMINRTMTKHTLALNGLGGTDEGSIGIITKEDLVDLIVDMYIDKSTGKLTGERYDGRKVPLNVSTKTAQDLIVSEGAGLNKGHKFITIIYDDNSRLSLDTQDFLKIYTGSRGDNILVSIGQDGQTIQADLLDRSIGIEKLNTDLQTLIESQLTIDDLPIAGNTLGMVKNGGNVEVNTDGTMDAANIRFDMNDGITPPAGIELTLAPDELSEEYTYNPRAYVVPRGTSTVSSEHLKPFTNLDTNGATVLRISCGNDVIDDSDAMTYTWYVKDISGETGYGYTALANTSSKTLDGTKAIFHVGKNYDVYCVVKGVGLDKNLYAAKSTNHVLVTVTAN